MENPSEKLGRHERYYDRWARQEGVPVIKSYHVEDINKMELKPWKRIGGKGALINLVGSEGLIDAHVQEIAPGGSLNAERHIYEEFIYVLEGSGATAVWNDGRPKQTFEWQTGSLFSPPLNSWHQSFNGSGTKPAKYIAVTLAPPVLNMYRNPGFVFNNPYVFTERYNGEEEYFSAQGKSLPGRIWESNFIADCRSFKLLDWKDRGAGGTNIEFEISDNSMLSHISEFPVGTYKKAHRHGPGAHIIILSGEGYSLMWPEGREPTKFEWREGSLIAPPTQWFHQHFNTGSRPARYLAIRRGGRLGPGENPGAAVSVKEGGWQIEYSDEDPRIHREFEGLVAESSMSCRMGALHPLCSRKTSAA